MADMSRSSHAAAPLLANADDKNNANMSRGAAAEQQPARLDTSSRHLDTSSAHRVVATRKGEPTPVDLFELNPKKIVIMDCDGERMPFDKLFCEDVGGGYDEHWRKRQ